VAHVVGLCFVGDRLPATHFLTLLGYSVSLDGNLYVAVIQPIENQPIQVTYRAVPVGTVVVSTAHAIGTMFAGLVGCAIGALAYRYREPT
jgi:hypothetical protein